MDLDGGGVVSFTKMEGAGNDFIVLDLFRDRMPEEGNLSELTRGESMIICL